MTSLSKVKQERNFIRDEIRKPSGIKSQHQSHNISAKSGLDTTDQMYATYNVHRKTLANGKLNVSTLTN